MPAIVFFFCVAAIAAMLGRERGKKIQKQVVKVACAVRTTH